MSLWIQPNKKQSVQFKAILKKGEIKCFVKFRYKKNRLGFTVKTGWKHF